MNNKKGLSILAVGILVAISCFTFSLQLDKDNMKQIECSVTMPPNKELLGEIIMGNDNVKLLADEIEQINKQKRMKISCSRDFPK